jgi:hypothetical protein
VGVLSIGIAQFADGWWKIMSGFSYCLMGVVGSVHGMWDSRTKRKLGLEP